MKFLSQIGCRFINLLFGISTTAVLLFNSCSNGWVKPNEINKKDGKYTYNFEKLDQVVLAYFESVNEKDKRLFMYITGLDEALSEGGGLFVGFWRGLVDQKIE